MREKRSFTIWTFVFCFVFNSILIAAFYLAAMRGSEILHQFIDPVLASEAQPTREDAQLAVSSINSLLDQRERYVAPAVFGLGGFVTLLLWLTVQLQGRRLANKVLAQSGSPPLPSGESSTKQSKKAASESRAARTPVIQMLSLLQREGRFVDFLQEDLRQYEDAQIGAAVRSIHEGCKKALSEHVVLTPVLEEEEGGEVTVQPGFDAHSIRLTGKVTGDPPFQGTLRHRGWKVMSVDLPRQVPAPEAEWILAPAEVDVAT